MANFVSPGSGGFPDINIKVPAQGGNANINPLRPSYFPRKVLQSGHAQMFRPDLDMHLRIQGLNVITNHFELMNAILPGAVWVIQNRAGAEMVKHAKINIEQMGAIETRDTQRSIHYFLSTSPTHITTSVGPTTFYAPLIEYGLGPHSAPKYGPRPFMMKSIYDVLSELIQAYVDLGYFVKRGGRGVITSRPYKPELESFLAKWRAHMYTTEKALGDVATMGGVGFSIPGTSGFRSGLLSGARIIGDVQSVMGRAVGARFSRRLSGKVTGRAIGIGSRTIFANKVYTAGPISGGNRIYNRLAGKYASRFANMGGFGG